MNIEIFLKENSEIFSVEIHLLECKYILRDNARRDIFSEQLSRPEMEEMLLFYRDNCEVIKIKEI